jgi:hypothetical protein
MDGAIVFQAMLLGLNVERTSDHGGRPKTKLQNVFLKNYREQEEDFGHLVTIF